MNKYKLPTGYLFVDKYKKGELETLSIGDYGKTYNVKANFLGYFKEINGVPNTECMPLSEKWVITLSTQYGCVMKCNFCDVPEVSWKGNVTFEDLKKQMYSAISLFPTVKYTERLNIHFARMGEPILNNEVFVFAELAFKNKQKIASETGLSIEVLHPVLTTSLPRRFSRLEKNILRWCNLKNHIYNGQAGLQFSINSTNEAQRTEMFGGLSLTIEELSRIAEKMPEPISRKYCLNFAYSTDYEIDGEIIKKYFDPEKFMCKITPIHNNNACNNNNIKTSLGYESYLPYKKPEDALMKAGFDVLVFVPSLDEEQGLVTCGNAILGGSKLQTETQKIKIIGL